METEEVLMPQRFKERAAELIGKMKKLSGFDAGANTRARPCVVARVMVAHILIAEGCTLHQAGRLLGRNHTTIIHYEKLMTAYLSSPGYDAERELWDRFLKEI